MPDLLISSPSNLNNCNIQEARVCEMETQVQSGKRHTIYHLKCTYGGSEYTTDKRYKDFQNLLQEHIHSNKNQQHSKYVVSIITLNARYTRPQHRNLPNWG
ncbi:hypothetical protein GJ496_009128 [Pomphorhynchus laevis]|nr:hypothetical protein GJ496_009128 [Pomphorhynchus laevis]